VTKRQKHERGNVFSTVDIFFVRSRSTRHAEKKMKPAHTLDCNGDQLGKTGWLAGWLPTILLLPSRIGLNMRVAENVSPCLCVLYRGDAFALCRSGHGVEDRGGNRLRVSDFIEAAQYSPDKAEFIFFWST